MSSKRTFLVVSLVASAGIAAAIVISLCWPRPAQVRENRQKPPSRTPAAPSEPVAKPPKPDIPSSLADVFDASRKTVDRMKAVDGLSRAQPPEVLAALSWLLRKRDEDEALRNNVGNKLRQCGEEHLVADLTAMLWDERETPKWRNYCVQHLRTCYEQSPDPATIEMLFKATECNEKAVRTCAVWSLARIATPRDKNRTPDGEVLKKIRAAALAALKETSVHFLVREAGVQSCARLGLTEALPDIRRIAARGGTRPTHLRIVAVAALGELEDAESTGLLEKLVKESTGQLHGAAEHALKRIRTAKAAERPPATPSGNSP